MAPAVAAGDLPRLVPFGTSAPELAVSLDAAVRGHVDLAAGNVVGSNLINTLLALLVLAVLARRPSLPGLAERAICPFCFSSR